MCCSLQFICSMLLPRNRAAESKHTNWNIWKLSSSYSFCGCCCWHSWRFQELNEVSSQIQTRTNPFCSFLQPSSLWSYLCSQDPILKKPLRSRTAEVLCYESLWETTPFNFIQSITSRTLNISSKPLKQAIKILAKQRANWFTNSYIQPGGATKAPPLEVLKTWIARIWDSKAGKRWIWINQISLNLSLSVSSSLHKDREYWAN